MRTRLSAPAASMERTTRLMNQATEEPDDEVRASAQLQPPAPAALTMFGHGGSRRRYNFYESPESSDGDDLDDAGNAWAWDDAASAAAADADAAVDATEAEPRAVQPADATAPHLDLPLPLLRTLFALLPADTRLRCREVCPGWRDVLQCKAFWCKLDISNTSGVAAIPSEAFVRALSHASGHRMEELHAHGCGALSSRTLRRLVSSNARTLRTMDISVGKLALQQLRAQRAATQRAMAIGDFASVMDAASAATMPRDLPELRCVARAGAALEELQADVRAGAWHATLLLRNCYGPLRARLLNVQAGFGEGRADDDPRSKRVARLGEALQQHPSLRRLDLTYAPLAPDDETLDAQQAEADPNVVAFGMLCDALASSTVDELGLMSCSCCTASLAHLGRLLGAGTLRRLALSGGDGYVDLPSDDDDDDDETRTTLFARPAPAFAAGLRGSSLTRLSLVHIALFDTATGAELLRELAGHATLRLLDVHDNAARGARARRAAGAALAAVLAGDGLEELNCVACKLGGEAMAPLFAALGTTTRLRVLSLACNGLSERDVVLGFAPALHNSSCGLAELRLRCGDCDGACSAAYAAAEAAEAEVAARARARGYVPYGGWPNEAGPPAADEEEEGDWEEEEEEEDREGC